MATYLTIKIDVIWLLLFIILYLQPMSSTALETDVSNITLFPNQQLYSPYIADPMRVSFSAQNLSLNKNTIPDSSRRFFDLKLGAALPIVEISNHSVGKLQVILEGGFHGIFDADQLQDNIGWDGIYSLYLVKKSNNKFLYRVGMRHISSHVGDEYQERTGIKRINYTRQELRAGMICCVNKKEQFYLDLGWGYDLRNRLLQQAWRSQTGFQYENLQLGDYPFGWYSAIDLSAYQENDWDVNSTLQTGLVFSNAERRWRFGLEFYNGRSQIGEYFLHRERYAGIGLWINL